jgi:hypothetical protein
VPVADFQYAELTGDSAKLWLRVDLRKRESIKLEFPYVAKLDANKIFFLPSSLGDEDKFAKRQFENHILNLIKKENPTQTIKSVSVNYVENKIPVGSFIFKISNYQEKFESLSFGSDSAEQDRQLLDYFVKTPAYDRVTSSDKGIVIGPKGSGKSSILRALAANNDVGHTIKITPEIFATSMLKSLIERGAGVEEERAFAATWEFSILLEVFKQLSLDSRSLPKPAHSEVVAFLRRYSDFVSDDLFSRFIRYLEQIQSVKVAGIEIAAKTKQLQALYALEPLYDLVLKIKRHMRKKILILIDELDQGWDNSDNANRFLAGLIQAAIKIQSLNIQAHVVVFVRSEIWELVRTKLAQLDKIRSSIERLRWSDGELMNLIFKRIAHQFSYGLAGYDPQETLGALFESTDGVPGFSYILSRTTRRPREVLQFARLAHQNAADTHSRGISREAIWKAEEEFSEWKLEHLCSEYLHIYPNIEPLLRLFRGKQKRISRSDLEFSILEFQESPREQGIWAKRDISEIVGMLYQIEFVGAKRAGKQRVTPKELDEFEFFYEASAPNLNLVDDFLFHPAFWKALELTG